MKCKKCKKKMKLISNVQHYYNNKEDGSWVKKLYRCDLCGLEKKTTYIMDSILCKHYSVGGIECPDREDPKICLVKCERYEERAHMRPGSPGKPFGPMDRVRTVTSVSQPEG